MKKDNKGFTLVELLAVIVILAIIMIIAIPAVLDTMQTARRKTFKEYILKVSNATQDKYMKDELTNGTVNQCFVYDITKDLGLPSTGNYKGYTIVTTNGNNEKTVYVTLYDNDFMVYGLKDSQIDKAVLLNYVDGTSQLSKENLAAVASCSTFTYIDNSEPAPAGSPAETPVVKTGTASATAEKSQPEEPGEKEKKLFTGEKKGKSGWVGVYVDGKITECYNSDGDIGPDGKTMGNGNKTNYCTKQVNGFDMTMCESAKSTICCTAKNEPDDPGKAYTYVFNENQATKDYPHQSCGDYFDPVAKKWWLTRVPGGELPESGVYED
jgi:type IV pilus assembly protein PilA